MRNCLFLLISAVFRTCVNGGLLKTGKPLTWTNSLPSLHHVRKHGIIQFINRFMAVQDIRNDDLKWGDEVEYGIFQFDEKEKKLRISLNAPEKLEKLNDLEASHFHRSEGSAWHPEFGAWMIEGTPRQPYRGFVQDLLRVQSSMRLRRARILSVLSENEMCPTVTLFPRLGATSDLTYPPSEANNGPIMKSKYLPDSVINPHPRFGTLAANIRSRRGSKVDIKVPLFRDRCTYEWNSKNKNSSKMVEMDCSAFGMGCCCLQVTFQARDLAESRYIFDQLAVLSPIMLALSAATPIFKGRLVDTDVRWNVISASMDDRTPSERKENSHFEGDKRMAGNGLKPIPKSRYGSISTYIHDFRQGEEARAWKLNHLNDIDCPIDEESYRTLLEGGIDKDLARHLAHLFTRDPLVIFEGRIEELNDDLEVEHFENIQSTNWQTVRWKPPPPRTGPNDPHIGWRTEFRSLEIQITDFENAAYVVFTVLITRVILAFDLCLYIPLSKVDENMQTSHKRGAVLGEKFYFRKCIDPLEPNSVPDNDQLNSYEEMTILEILMGKDSSEEEKESYPGLIPLIYAYLDHIGTDPDTFEKVEKYLDFLKERAMGSVLTCASWMRDFVRKHRDYENDSVVSDAIAYDLMHACKNIGEGKVSAPSLLGSEIIEPITSEAAFDVPLVSKRIDKEKRKKLIARYGTKSKQAQKVDLGTSSSSFSSTFEKYDEIRDCQPFVWEEIK